MKISVYVVTLNEEQRLERTLKAASQVADEIVIVDSGSTDKTEQIAKKFGAKFIFHKWKQISAQKSFAQNKCSYQWLLSLDADEVLSPELIKEIKQIKKNPKADVYKIKISDMAPKDKKPKVFAKTYILPRLYNKEFANMPDDLTNDRLVIKENAKIVQLKGSVYHYSFLTLSRFWAKLNVYTDELVKTAVANKKKYSLFRLVTEFPRQFVIYYFFKKYFLQGTWGFIMATTLAYFRFLKIAKWFEQK